MCACLLARMYIPIFTSVVCMCAGMFMCTFMGLTICLMQVVEYVQIFQAGENSFSHTFAYQPQTAVKDGSTRDLCWILGTDWIVDISILKEHTHQTHRGSSP